MAFFEKLKRFTEGFVEGWKEAGCSHGDDNVDTSHCENQMGVDYVDYDDIGALGHDFYHPDHSCYNWDYD